MMRNTPEFSTPAGFVLNKCRQPKMCVCQKAKEDLDHPRAGSIKPITSAGTSSRFVAMRSTPIAARPQRPSSAGLAAFVAAA